MPSAKPNDNQLIRMLASGNHIEETKAFNQLYADYYGLVESLITTNSGTPDDVPEVFNEVLLIIHRNANKPDFKLSATLKTFLYSITRNIWLAILRKRRNNKVTELNEIHESIPVENDFYKTIELNDQQEKIKKLLDQLGEDCKTIIKLYYFLKWKMREIAEHLDIQESAAKNRKSRCLKKLRGLI